MQKDIPVYSSDQELVGFWSPEQVARAFSERYLLRLVRKRNGEIVRAIRKQLPGESKACTQIKQGVKTTYLQRLPNVGASVWAMKRLVNGAFVVAK